MKYIDAEKLIAEIERRKEFLENGTGHPEVMKRVEGVIKAYNSILSFIASLQQEQPGLPGIEDPGIPGKDYIPVEWVDACEKYGKWKIVKQDQPEVDLEGEIKKMLNSDYYKQHIKPSPFVIDVIKYTARHFYELGLNARR